MKRAAGFGHQAAVRALAYKWIRTMFRLWKTRTTYNENATSSNSNEETAPW